jgi:hypothetical protein
VQGKKQVWDMEVQLQQEVKKLAADLNCYAGADALGLKAEIGLSEISDGVFQMWR